jgi:hypothetical protein
LLQVSSTILSTCTSLNSFIKCLNLILNNFSASLWMDGPQDQSGVEKAKICICAVNLITFPGFFFLSFNHLIGWHLSIWICCQTFFSLLYNCQLLCFWRLSLSTVIEVFPWPFSRYCSFKDVYYKLVMPNYMPSP